MSTDRFFLREVVKSNGNISKELLDRITYHVEHGVDDLDAVVFNEIADHDGKVYTALISVFKELITICKKYDADPEECFSWAFD